ncbi:MAG: hypothetical protein KAR42_04125 [candidate division Zixibacteria bacterium]|nr:hypothetical protein [candidate division Zixibacteria bacterium]
MRLTVIFLSVLLLATGVVGSENPEDESMKELLSNERYYQCVDFTFNATLLIPQLYASGQIDSIYLILDFIEEKCYKAFRWTNTRMLLKMEEGKFTEDLYDSTILYDMIGYRRYYEVVQERAGFLRLSYSTLESEASITYGEFIYDLAARMYERYPSGSLEHLWAGFFKGDFNYFYREIKLNRYSSTKLQMYYMEVKDRLIKEYHGKGGHSAGFVGTWLPQGKNELLGNKPEFGLMFGNKYKTFQVDATVLFRLFNAENEYSYVKDGTLITTDYFLGGYIGLDVGYEIFTKGKNQFELLGGIGYDGFDANSSDDDDKAHTIGSLNLNLGFRHKLFVSKYHDWYVGIQGRYNWVKYGTGGGSDLSGNTISLQLIVGRINSGAFKDYAEKLGFYD